MGRWWVGCCFEWGGWFWLVCCVLIVMSFVCLVGDWCGFGVSVGVLVVLWWFGCVVGVFGVCC